MTYRYFKLDEFKCNHCGENKIDPDFVSKLDSARGMAGVPFVITSGYRCIPYDLTLGGKRNHTTGLAADIAVPDDRSRYFIIKYLLLCGFARIGVGPDFIHVDMNPQHNLCRIWGYYEHN